MGNSNISFPGLGLNFNINPIAFSILGKAIHWYGIIIACGLLLAVLYTSKRSKEYNVKSDDLLNLLLLAVPIAIIGARAYYVIFNFEPYRNNLWGVFAIWNGGLAIYGGIIAGAITAIVYARIKKIKIGDLFDLCSFGLLIGQAIGRYGNFVNREAFGGPTDLPWRMVIDTGAGIQAVHPTFFYESTWNIVGFIVLHFYSKHRKFSGEIFLLYAAWYGLGRGFVEGLRTDSLYLLSTGIRVSQVLGFTVCLASIVFLIVKYRQNYLKQKNAIG
jgi:phosphatidylglycerol---prolipoprotein diacylglyceryl transferase